MNAHMHINSPVLWEQAMRARERRERLVTPVAPRARLTGDHFNHHIYQWWRYVSARNREAEERRQKLLAHRRALINKWGRYHRASGLAPTDEEMAVEQFTQPPIARIIYVVASHFGMSIPDILSHRRQAEIVHARHVAMYLAKVMTTRSLPHIGRNFGDRDHTTVLHAARKTHFLVTNDETFAAEVEGLRQAILEQPHAGA